MTFVFDENIPPKLVRILEWCDHHGQHRYFHVTELYPRGTADDAWMPDVGRDHAPAIIVTGDWRAESAVMRKHQLSCVLPAKGLCSGFFYESHGTKKERRLARVPFADSVWRWVKAWPGVIELADKARGRIVIFITVNGIAKSESRGGGTPH